MKPTIRITNVFRALNGEDRVRYTFTIPLKRGTSVISGHAGIDESIEIPDVDEEEAESEQLRRESIEADMEDDE